MARKKRPGQALGRPGYHGWVTLVSPEGETARINLSGRENSGAGVKVSCYYPGYEEYRRKVDKADLRLRRLLSAGWKVVPKKTLRDEDPEVLEPENGQETKEDSVEEGNVGEEEKKNTDQVIGTSKLGSQSHGGDHASGEVVNSPNRAKRGKRAGRGRRKGEPKNQRPKHKAKVPKVRMSSGTGGNPVFAPQPIRCSQKIRESAEKSAELLAELVGKSVLCKPAGVTTKVEEFLLALETGDDPLPYLEARDERPKALILVSPDCSGSTANWNGLGQAWALALAKNPALEVIYLENFNGEFYNPDFQDGRDLEELLKKVDFLIYLGDGQGLELAEIYAARGATVLGIDNGCSAYGAPRLRRDNRFSSGGRLIWVDRVTARDLDSWAEAVRRGIEVQ